MTSENNERGRCRAGQECRSAEPVILPDGLRVLVAGTDEGRGLCLVCEQYGRWVLEQMPRLYADLHEQLGKDGGRNVSPRFGSSGGKGAPPLPVRLDVDERLRWIEWVVQVWATAVWDRAGGLGTSPDEARWSVGRCCGFLGRFFTALCVLPATTYVPYLLDGEPEPVDADGPAAVLELIDLYRRARSWIGETRRVEPRHMPCPPRGDGGCGQEATLVQEIGADGVWCTTCGWQCTDEEYGTYAISYSPPARRDRLELVA